jgi:hypothetical protein
MDIYFIWGTVRPDMMYETYKHWINTCVLETTIHVKCAVSTIEQKQKIDSFNIPNCDVFVVNEKPGYTYAVNYLSQNLIANNDDVLIYLTDDFYSPFGWDSYLTNKFLNFDGGLFLNDGYQDVHSKNGIGLALTITCITYSCLIKLNRVVLHPDYYHFYSDNEIFQNLKALNLLKDDRDIDDEIFEHRHYAHGNGRSKDKHDEKHILHCKTDGETFNRRMKLPIEERLKINE